MTNNPIYHNPDNLETAGDPPWRFGVQGEPIGENWQRLEGLRPNQQWMAAGFIGQPQNEFHTYRTRAALPAPQPGGGGEAEWQPESTAPNDRLIEVQFDRSHTNQQSLRIPCRTDGGEWFCEAMNMRIPRSSTDTWREWPHQPTPPIALPVRAEVGTPRTDAHLEARRTSPGPNLWASADFARTLERELQKEKEVHEMTAQTLYAKIDDCGQAREERDQAATKAAALSRELEEARRHIFLASGYHARTEREIEIEAALNDTPGQQLDSADHAIKELLELVDAGRSRYFAERDAKETLRAELEEAKAERDAARHTRDRLAEHQAETERRLSAELTALRAAPRSEGAIESAIQRFADKKRGIPQACLAAELIEEMRAALDSLAPRSETEGRDKERLDALDLMAVEMVEGTDCVSLTLFMKPGQKIRDAIDDLTSSVLAHDEKGAGE